MCRLYADEFTGDLLPEVLDFNCGDEPWALLAAEWIRSSNGAKSSIVKHGTQVFLYYTINGDLVGFGSVGTAKWPEYHPNALPIIPMVAVAKRFQRQGYCTEIMNDLIDRAAELGGNVLVLTVHPDNPALALYEKLGFVKQPQPAKHGNVKMARPLAPANPQGG